MGWKSTIRISRAHALELISVRAQSFTCDQLAETLETLGYGDDPNLPHHGNNFIVDPERDERAEYERLKEKFGG